MSDSPIYAGYVIIFWESLAKVVEVTGYIKPHGKATQG